MSFWSQFNQADCRNRCPFYEAEKDDCRAATFDLPLGPVSKTDRCLSEDFDDCPHFLGRLLRGSRPRALSRRQPSLHR